MSDAALVQKAAQILKDGGLVAIPTETVYGLAADATQGKAVARIFEAKGRPSFNPLIVHVGDRGWVSDFAQTEERFVHLADVFWPGPLTLVAPIRDTEAVCDLARAGLDTVAIRRALTNLVVNAIEHAGGAVAVKLEATLATLTVEVRANGPGIAPGELKRLFRPFERGRTAEARGAGLGLAITLGLVEVHGGTLSARANDDRGSTFTVTLPAGMVPLEAAE